MTPKNYSARSAALRALKAAKLDPRAFDIVKDANGRWSWIAKPVSHIIGSPIISHAGKAALSKAFGPANPTRKAELERARTEAAAKKLAGSVKKFTQAHIGKRAQAIADAQAGKLPAAPDFSAETHTRFRPKLAELVALVKAKNIKALKAYEIKAISTSPKAMDRYRNLAVIALEAQAAKQKSAA